MDPRSCLDTWRNLASNEIRWPDRPARSESLCRLSYPGPPIFVLGFVEIILSVITVEIVLLHTLCEMRKGVRGFPKCTCTSDHQEQAMVEPECVFRLNSLAA